MKIRHLAAILSGIMLLGGLGLAQEDGLQSSLDYKINKMKKELKLTDAQAEAVRPVLKDYLIKHSEYLEGMEGQGIVDHVEIKSRLRKLKDQEHRQLSKILSPEQMQKLIDKENLMASLNPDGAESTVDDGVSMTPEGASMKF